MPSLENWDGAMYICIATDSVLMPMSKELSGICDDTRPDRQEFIRANLRRQSSQLPLCTDVGARSDNDV